MDSDKSIEDYLDNQFNKAADYITSSSFEACVKDRLYLYSHYKQATEGDCNIPKPGIFDLQGKKKWEAWNTLRGLSKLKAKKQYTEKVNEISPYWELASPARIGWVSVSTMMKERGVDDSEKTIFDFVQESNLEKLKQLPLRELNQTDESGMTPLHWACDRGHSEMVQYLLEKFPQCIDTQDLEGQTPLHYAVSCSHVDVTKILLGHKANVNIKDNEGNLPKDIIQEESIAILFVK